MRMMGTLPNILFKSWNGHCCTTQVPLSSLVMIVSFIDKVANQLLIFDGSGNTELFEGNWLLWQARVNQEGKSGRRLSNDISYR